MQRSSIFLIVIALSVISMADEPRGVKGRVVDFNSPENNPTGIGAVKVNVFDKNHKHIEEAQSDKDGYYTLKKVGIGDDVTIEHYKEYYINAPEKVAGVLRESTITVTMMRSNADEAYYKGAGQKLYARVASLVALQPALDYVWEGFRHFDLPLQERQIVKQEIAGKIGQATIDSVDAKYTGLKVKDKDPGRAIQAAVAEDLLHDVYFAPGGETLSIQSMTDLKISASFVDSAANIKLYIVGSADQQESSTKEGSLAKKRAAAVRNYLISEGISPSRLTIISGRKPLQCQGQARNQDSCEAENRKVRLEIYDGSGAALASPDGPP
jgi:outer membrane protein OmpA-like peptidoglycan-associated protein